MNTPLDTMRAQAAAYAAERDRLAALVQEMKDEVSVIERRAMPAILRSARKISALHNDLVEEIGAHADCFVKPRTLVVDGLKFGLQKKRGTVQWDHDDQVIARARKLLDATQFALVVQTVYKISATGLAQLDAATLKRLGVSVTRDTDAPIIKNTDGAVEKIVNAMIKEMTAEAEVEVAA